MDDSAYESKINNQCLNSTKYSNDIDANKVALVFGARGEQGRAVLEGLLDCGKYAKVYAFTSTCKTSDTAAAKVAIKSTIEDTTSLQYLSDGLNASIITGDLSNGADVRKALLETKAQKIFLVTATQLPTDIDATITTSFDTGYLKASENEFQVIVQFFHTLKECYEIDKLPRHVVFSIRDNVQDATFQVLQRTGELWIPPLDDGSIVPHFSAKGKGGEYALKYLVDTPDLQLTLITMPFLYSNFLGFFAPIPIDNDDGRSNQWALTACFGDGGNKIDMMSASDLAHIVPNIFSHSEQYNQKNLRLVAERISMDDIAYMFSDLFGKDVIYNPLTFDEVSLLPIPTAPAMAQMCLFVGNPPPELRHSIDDTTSTCYPRKPQMFKDWLLIHSSADVFQQVGLDVDAPEITKVVVFGATSPEGVSVVKGLLSDKRKQYKIRVTVQQKNEESKHYSSDSVHKKVIDESFIHQLIGEESRNRIEIVYADLCDLASCQKAVEGMEGVFLVTDFYTIHGLVGLDVEEKYAMNVINACESSPSIRHLVFSIKESAEEMSLALKRRGIQSAVDPKINNSSFVNGTDTTSSVSVFNVKERAAAYARTKKISVTFVLMPCYSEMFFDMIRFQNNKSVVSVPLQNHNKKMMCMSVDDLGPAVANIFDSYQVYAGHEVGLVTDFVSMSDVCNIMEDIFLDYSNGTRCTHGDEEKASSMTTKSVVIPEATDEEQSPYRNDTESKNDRSMKDTQNHQQKKGEIHHHYNYHETQTYMKDFGQMFVSMVHNESVQKRHSIAKTMRLVPSARPLREWIQQNVDNVTFREKLGLR